MTSFTVRRTERWARHAMFPCATLAAAVMAFCPVVTCSYDSDAVRIVGTLSADARALALRGGGRAVVVSRSLSAPTTDCIPLPCMAEWRDDRPLLRWRVNNDKLLILTFLPLHLDTFRDRAGRLHAVPVPLINSCLNTPTKALPPSGEVIRVVDPQWGLAIVRSKIEMSQLGPLSSEYFHLDPARHAGVFFDFDRDDRYEHLFVYRDGVLTGWRLDLIPSRGQSRKWEMVGKWAIRCPLDFRLARTPDGFMAVTGCGELYRLPPGDGRVAAERVDLPERVLAVVQDSRSGVCYGFTRQHYFRFASEPQLRRHGRLLLPAAHVGESIGLAEACGRVLRGSETAMGDTSRLGKAIK